MDNLTQEEAERCARARGWTERAGIWFDGDGMRVPLSDIGKFFDSHFWFPRLWEKLEGVAPRGAFRAYRSIDASVGVEWPDGGLTQTTASYDHPCLALCAAIEALEGKI